MNQFIKYVGLQDHVVSSNIPTSMLESPNGPATEVTGVRPSLVALVIKA
jgi:hypothetical protein